MQLFHGSLLLDLAIEQTIEGGDAAPSGELLVGLIFVEENGVLGRMNRRGAAPERAPVHEDDIDRDAVNPGTELSFTPEATEALVHLHEDLLDEIFEIGAAARHAVDQARHAGAVFAKELTESRRLAGFAPRDQVAPVAHQAERSAFRRRALARRVDPMLPRRGCGPGPPVGAR